MSAGADIAAEIAAALAEAGEATGAGPLVCTLRKPATGGPETPWDTTPAGPPDLHELVAVDEYQQIQDASGTLTGQQIRKLTVNATGAVPQKADQIAIGVAKADVTADTRFEEIEVVRPVAPGGVALMYELELAV